MDILILLALIANFYLLYFSIFWLITFFENNGRIHEKKKLNRFPLVSIVIPAHNEEKNIKNAIESCLNLNYPKNKLEVIVVNDGSTDRTVEICKSYEEKGLIKLINKERGGKASALNLGLKIAKGEIFACLDADSIYAKDALIKMLAYFDDENVATVTPVIKVKESSNTLEKFQYIEYLINALYAKLYSFLNCIYVIPGPGSLYRKEVLEKLGGFDENSLTEDMEITFRIHKYGFWIKNCFDAIVLTSTPKSIVNLFKQRLRWNTGFLETLSKHKDVLSREYGTFGTFLLPSVLIGLVICLIYLLIILKPFYNYIKSFYHFSKINFDIFPFLGDFKINIDVFSINTLSFIFFCAFLIYILYFYLATKHQNEFTKNRLKDAVFASIIYTPLLSVFALCSLINFVKRRIKREKDAWKK
ncbi:MAG: glycosyltransferase family 2 protein [Candidatus Parvarchaeota archaeon]|nr:glycosyltransferase family 2 protein [Candidatus Jingweiarchaeum tengchongense]MCW1297848.1 glycosyltransferase family 2 protein [Candidatus Jingweiarchaeum tengchongense]MCW1299859.1 glycosyltransferase family 2 protein [Candidatus Jingweiarchaeum tengchongense]MCW1304171.1 glycosyltransferase family 2 protein [Candidatus Jingweiarchaeum tengchongense]MCW1305199.1 glycosyltransferase family 2 protein [Candidatus Jingweiarchaeum tengchongense]